MPLALAETFNGGPVTCASFPTVDLFSPAAQAITGFATPPKEGWTISLNVHPRLAGLPVPSNARGEGVCAVALDGARGQVPDGARAPLEAFSVAGAHARQSRSDQ